MPHPSDRAGLTGVWLLSFSGTPIAQPPCVGDGGGLVPTLCSRAQPATAPRAAMIAMLIVALGRYRHRRPRAVRLFEVPKDCDGNATKDIQPLRHNKYNRYPTRRSLTCLPSIERICATS